MKSPAELAENSAGRSETGFGAFGEYLLLVPVMISVVWLAGFFFEHHYLPQPYVPDVNDTFMDWFNVAYFAHNTGAYNIFRSVYPPISFVFLRLFTTGSCFGDPYNARYCDWLGISTILICYALDCAVAALAFRRRNPATALPRSLAFAFGLPLLFTLERGNLILVCIIPYMLAYGDMLGSKVSRAVAVATTINFKPYLAIPSMALVIRRDWRGIEQAGIATIALYLLTLLLFGSGTFSELLYNAGGFSDAVKEQFWNFAYYSTSYASLQTIGDSPIPILNFISSRTLSNAIWLIPVLIHATQAIALIGLAAAWVQPNAISTSRIVALLVGAELATQSPGGYTFSFLIFPVFLEVGRRPGQVVALFAAYALSIHYDIGLATVVNGISPSWLSGRAVHVNFGLAIGQFVRPGLTIVIVWSLTLDTITQSIVAHRSRRPTLGMLPVGEPAVV